MYAHALASILHAGRLRVASIYNVHYGSNSSWLRESSLAWKARGGFGPGAGKPLHVSSPSASLIRRWFQVVLYRGRHTLDADFEKDLL